MPQIGSPSLAAPDSGVVSPVRFTLAQFDRMIEHGVFDETSNRRIELIRGELCAINPPGPTQEYVIDLLTRWAFRAFPQEDVLIRIQNSLGLPALESASQPDLACVRRKSYRQGRPTTNDVLLVVEVSHSTLKYDRTVKQTLYAEAGIGEYWIVNLVDECVEVHRAPVGDTYGSKQVVRPGDAIACQAFPIVKLDPAAIFEG